MESNSDFSRTNVAESSLLKIECLSYLRLEVSATFVMVSTFSN